eukprot:1587675-Amphidinium_carterae.1
MKELIAEKCFVTGHSCNTEPVGSSANAGSRELARFGCYPCYIELVKDFPARTEGRPFYRNPSCC